jgi:hypothetical protein
MPLCVRKSIAGRTQHGIVQWPAATTQVHDNLAFPCKLRAFAILKLIESQSYIVHRPTVRGSSGRIAGKGAADITRSAAP